MQEELAKLLRYETSATQPGETISLADYVKRMHEDQKEIFYLTAPRYIFHLKPGVR